MASLSASTVAGHQRPLPTPLTSITLATPPSLLPENPRRLLRRISLHVFTTDVVPRWTAASKKFMSDDAKHPSGAGGGSTSPTSAAHRQQASRLHPSLRVSSAAADVAAVRQAALARFNQDYGTRSRLDAIALRAERDALGPLFFESKLIGANNSSSSGGVGSTAAPGSNAYQLHMEGFVAVLLQPIVDGLLAESAVVVVHDATGPATAAGGGGGGGSHVGRQRRASMAVTSPLTNGGMQLSASVFGASSSALLQPSSLTLLAHGGGESAVLSAWQQQLHGDVAQALQQLFRAIDATESGCVSLDQFVEFYIDTEDGLDRWSLAEAQQPKGASGGGGANSSTGGGVASSTHKGAAHSILPPSPAAGASSTPKAGGGATPATTTPAAAGSVMTFPDVRFFVQAVSSQMLADARDAFERKREEVEHRFTEKLLLERSTSGGTGLEPFAVTAMGGSGDGNSGKPQQQSHAAASSSKAKKGGGSGGDGGGDADGPSVPADEQEILLRINPLTSAGCDVAILYVSMHPLSIFAAGYKSGTVRYLNSDTYDINLLIKPCELKSTITAMCYASGRRLTSSIPGMNAFSAYIVACCGDLSMRIIPSRKLSTFSSHAVPEVLVAVAYDPVREVVVAGGRSGTLLVWVVSATGFVSMLRRLVITTFKNDVLLSMLYIADPIHNLVAAGTQDGKMVVVPLREEPALLLGTLAIEVRAFQTASKPGAVDVAPVTARRIDVLHHVGPVQHIAYSQELRIVIGACFSKILCFARDAVRSQPYSLIDDPSQQSRRLVFLAVERSGGCVVAADETGCITMWSLGSMDVVDTRDVIYGGTVGGGGGATGADGSSSSSSTGSSAPSAAASAVSRTVPRAIGKLLSSTAASANSETLVSGFYNTRENAILANTTSTAVLIRLQTKAALTAGALLAQPSNDVVLLCLHPTAPGVIVIVTAFEVVLVNAADLSRLFASTIGEFHLTRDAIACAVLSKSGSRVILGSIAGEVVTARVDTGRVVRRVDMPRHCGAVSSLSYGFGGVVEPNQLVCITASNCMVVFNDYGGDMFDCIVPVRVLRHDRLFAAKVYAIPSPSFCYIILDWSFYVHTGGWDVSGKELALRPVTRCRGRANLVADEEEAADAAARDAVEYPEGLDVKDPAGGLSAKLLPSMVVADPKDRVIPPSDQVACMLSLHPFTLYLVVCATTSGSLFLFGLPPLVLENKSICSWRNRSFAYRAFCSDDPVKAQAHQQQQHAAKTQQPSHFGRLSPAKPVAAAGPMDQQTDTERVNAPVVEQLAFIPPYTLVTVDDTDQLVLWDISDVVLQTRPCPMLDRRPKPASPSASSTQHRNSTAGGGGGGGVVQQQPRFSNFFHRVTRPPFVKIVAWTLLPRPATSLVFLPPCCLFLLDGRGIAMIYRVDAEGLTKVGSVGAAMQPPVAERKVHRARFRVRHVVTTADIELAAKNANEGFFSSLGQKPVGGGGGGGDEDSRAASDASGAPAAGAVRHNHAAIVRRWRHLFHVLRITWLMQKYIVYGAVVEAADSTAAQDLLEGFAMNGSVLGQSQLSTASRSTTAAAASTTTEDRHASGKVFPANYHGGGGSDDDTDGFGHFAEHSPRSGQSTGGDAGGAADSSSSGAKTKKTAPSKQPYPFTSDRALVIRMDAGFGSPNHRCQDLEWAFDLTCAEEGSGSDADEGGGGGGAAFGADDGNCTGASPLRRSSSVEHRHNAPHGIAKFRRKALVEQTKLEMVPRHTTALAHGGLLRVAASCTTGINTTSPQDVLHGATLALQAALRDVHAREAAFSKQQKAEEADWASLGLDENVMSTDAANHLLVKKARLLKLGMARRMTIVAEKTGAMLEADCGVSAVLAQPASPRRGSSFRRGGGGHSSSWAAEDVGVEHDGSGSDSCSFVANDDADDGGGASMPDTRARKVRHLSLAEQLQSVVQASDTLDNLDEKLVRQRMSRANMVGGGDDGDGQHPHPSHLMRRASSASGGLRHAADGSSSSSNAFVRDASMTSSVAGKTGGAAKVGANGLAMRRHVWASSFASALGNSSAEGPSPASPSPVQAAASSAAAAAKKMPAHSNILRNTTKDSRDGGGAPADATIAITSVAGNPTSWPQSASHTRATPAAAAAVVPKPNVWILPTSSDTANTQQKRLGDTDDDDANGNDVTAQEIFSMLRDDQDSAADRLASIADGQRRNADRLRLPTNDPLRRVTAVVGGGENRHRPDASNSSSKPFQPQAIGRPMSATGQLRKFR